MRKYEVHIPKDELELRELEGKAVKFFDDCSAWLSKDRLIFKLNLGSIEFIHQGMTLSSPAYPDYLIYSENIELINLKFNFQGLISKFNTSYVTYKDSETDYSLRKEALEKVGLWTEPSM